jgi:hypothetical protein
MITFDRRSKRGGVTFGLRIDCGLRFVKGLLFHSLVRFRLDLITLLNVGSQIALVANPQPSLAPRLGGCMLSYAK